MKNLKERIQKIDLRSTKIFIIFLRFSVLFLIFGFFYYVNILNGKEPLSQFESIYSFIESAFYLLAIGFASMTLFEYLVKKNNQS